MALFALVALAGLGAAWGITASLSSDSAVVSGPSVQTAEMDVYVGGHWVRFTSRRPLSAEQWSVVDDYANFSSAVLAVYATRSVAPLAPVVSPQSKVVAMFTRDLATGVDPEALYASATIEQVSISGCRARLTLELSYPGGRHLHYVSSWVRPFDRAGLSHRGPGGSGHATLSALGADQYAPWQFVGDNRVGGVDTPCGI
ncbi:MAG: hypothetical protein M0010_03225 [Actinomycetota bacterium]|nr:hypothetical protein [Actinomycetota bacterium]